MKRIVLVLILSIAQAQAATYMKCTSKDLATCKEIYKKGAVIKALAVDPNLIFIKVDFVEFNESKGTLKVVTE